MKEADRDVFTLARDSRGVPEISILMPVFEQERYVAEAVRSVLAQTDVVAEVIVSDDASTDGTWARAEAATAGAPPHPHRVVLRRGSSRLRRNHTVLLAEHASSPIVMLAHGDDVSAPGRARRLIDALDTTGATLAGSQFRTIDHTGRETADGPEPRADLPLGLLGPHDLIPWSRVFTGALLAWRPAALAGFARLDRDHAATGHDRVLPFRAGLAGGVTVVPEPLVDRRVHAESWSHGIWDRRSAPAARFGRQLNLLTATRAMQADVVRAVELGLVAPAEADRLQVALEAEAIRRIDDAMGAHDELLNDGLVPLWVSEQEARLAYRGELGAELARRARRWVAIERAAGTARRWRHRVRARPTR